jgi:hypothetical protein
MKRNSGGSGIKKQGYFICKCTRNNLKIILLNNFTGEILLN